MSKVFLITHVYDVDGGFGDAIAREKVVAATVDRKAAYSCVEKFSKSGLSYGDLQVREVELKTGAELLEKNPIPEEEIKNFGKRKKGDNEDE